MSKISEKRSKLLQRGFDIGAPLDPVEKDADYTGVYQRFANATLYWHPVMGTEAHEVHGGILSRYLKAGGPGVNQASNHRDLGFPLSDEGTTKVSGYPISYFELGAIIWKHGAGLLSGPFYKAWEEQGAETGDLGYPISEEVAVAGGRAVFFEFGCLWSGLISNNGVLRFDFEFPRPGDPAFVNALAPGLKSNLRVKLLGTGPVDAALKALPSALFRDRFFLAPTGKPTHVGENQPVVLNFGEGAAPFLQLPVFGGAHIRMESTATLGAALADRTLYDVVMRLPAGDFNVVAPHAIYAKASWRDFGVMHATDIHVSARLDGFRTKLNQAGRTEGAAAFNNYNDNFRDLIRYANQLHDAGQLDLIMATGDLVDYEFEESDWRSPTDHEAHGGNFARFLKLLLGQSPSSVGEPHQELLVPILTTLGNHDYRWYRYLLNFDISVPVLDDPTVRNFQPHNLMNEDANSIQGGFKTISKEAAVDMAKTNKLPAFYYKRVGRSSFVKQIGDHRVVMLDTGSDAGILDSTSDGIRSYFGIDTSESERNFADGNPDSVGVDDSWLRTMKKVLDANPSGVVLVGMHAPPVNPSGNEYPHFFRETEHPTLESVGVVYSSSSNPLGQAFDDVGAYLVRRHGVDFNPLSTKGKPYFAKGKVGDYLDYGIAKNKADEWLQLFAGVGTARKVDAVLFGHVHYRAEFRVVWDAGAKKFEFYFDFYTENPGVYYNSRKLGHSDPVSIEVRQDAPPKGTMIEVDTPWGKTKRLRVPPYATPLNSATDKRAWWNTHRPLLLQTAPVGPTETNQRHETIQGKKRTYPGPSFSGCRLIAVKNNVIDTISYVTMPEIRRKLSFTSLNLHSTLNQAVVTLGT